MTVPWGGFPDGTFGDDLSGLSGLDEASWRAGLNSKVIGSGSGAGSGFNGLSAFFGFLNGTVDGHTAELAGLQSTTQKLEGIIGYAHGFISGGWSTTVGLGKRSVNNEIGTTVGVTRQSGAYFLHSKGLWVADAILNVDQSGLFVADKAELQIRVYAPNGSLHFVRSAFENTGMQTTLAVHVPFTVPSSGYYVELWADVAVARNVPTGSRFTGLSVEKRSSEVD